ncbi:MAG: outer membrane protein assembly factor BamA [Spirochaetaceae bacterium]|nr:outer membrane protein assembly factor BamA [Spirochaetaceae bacterium]
MSHMRFRHFLCALVLVVLSAFELVATDAEPWYNGQPISGFVNTGLQNLRESKIKGIESKYLNQEYSDELFQKLQADLYATNAFLYFLGNAEKNEEGKLVLSFEFHELPAITDIQVVGNETMKLARIRGVITQHVGDFASTQNVLNDKQAIINLYHGYGYNEVTVEESEVEDDAANTAAVTYTINEGSQKKVAEVEFDGALAFPYKTLRRQLSSRIANYLISGYYEESRVAEDRTNIETFYRNNGYMDARVTDVATEVIPSEDPNDKFVRLRLVYHIDEGQQWKFGGMSFSGNTVYSDEELSNLITIPEGEILSQEKLQSLLGKISDQYYNNGYVHNNMQVEAQRDKESSTIHYVIHIDEQGLATISDIRLLGLTKTKPYVFLRELTVHKGDVFSKEKLQKSAQNIYNTLIVTDVKLELQEGDDPNTVIPVFNIIEGNQMTIQFGATFGGSVDSFPISGFLQWQDKNLFGTGRDLSISTTLSPDSQEVSLSISDDWVGYIPWSNSLSLSFSRTSKNNGLQRNLSSPYYTGHDTDDDKDQAYPLGYDSYIEFEQSGEANPSSAYLMSYDYWNIALSYSSGYTFRFDAGNLRLSGGLSIGLKHAVYDDDLYLPFEYLMYLYHKDWQFSNKLSFTVTWDGRDLIENTTRGYILSNTFTYAGGILGGLSNYLKDTASASGYLTVGKYSLGDKDASIVLGATSSVSVMLPQYWNNTYDVLGGDGWDWYDAKRGATRYEMLYIDGMNIGRGFDVVYDQSFLWNNEISLSAPLVVGVLNWEVYASATGVVSNISSLRDDGFSSLNWYFSAGAGLKLKIPGFPLGLYLVKNAKWMSDGDFHFIKGSIFHNGGNSGMKLVLAITQSIY